MQGDVIDSWEERLRLTLDHFRNENMADFRKNSEAYRRLVREEEEAYAKLDTLNLTEEQREFLSKMPLKQRQKEILKEEYRNGEIYIPIPIIIHQRYPDFFPKRDYNFNLQIPTGAIFSAKAALCIFIGIRIKDIP